MAIVYILLETKHRGGGDQTSTCYTTETWIRDCIHHFSYCS